MALTPGENGRPVVTKAELARWLGVSPNALTVHVDAGHFVKSGSGFDLRASIASYCGHLRDVASGRGGAKAIASLTEERARLASAQAEQVEMKNAIARGEYARTADVQREWSDILRDVRSALLAVPSRVRGRLGHIGQMEASVIDREIRDALVRLGEDEPDERAA